MATVVSVCIPTYNGAAYLSDAVASVFSQTLTDFELIVVDDQSTDDSLAVARSFTDSRLRVYQNASRLGLVGNWNRCLELACGEYVCLFHQDDVMLPDNLARKVDLLAENPAVGLVYSDVYIIDQTSQVTAKGWFYPTTPAQNFTQAGCKFFETLILANNIICCPSVVVRRDCFEKLGLFDSRLPFTTDWEMWLRITLFYDVAYLIEPLVKYRWHNSNESHQFLGVSALEHAFRGKMLVLEKYAEKIPGHQQLKRKVISHCETEALDQAWYHRQHFQDALAKQYLEFALTMHSKIEDTPLSESTRQWILETADRLWLQKIEAPSAGQSLIDRPAVQKILNELSGAEIARSIPIRKLIQAVFFKVAAHPPMSWLRFRDPKKLDG